MNRPHQKHSMRIIESSAALAVIFVVMFFAALPAAAQEETETVSQRLAVQADREPVHTSGLSRLLEDAYEHNPGILAARAQWQAAVEKYPQANALPDPTLTFTWFPEPIETRLGPNRTQVKLGQMFPAPGKLRLMGDRAAAAAEAARLKYEIAVRDTVTEVRISYAELQYIDRAIELTSQNSDLVNRLASLSEKDYASQQASLYDMSRAQAQLARVEYDLQLLQELRQTEITHMNTLLDRPPETPVEIWPLISRHAPDMTLDELYDFTEKHRQEIELAGVMEDSGKIGVALAKKKSLPDFSAGIVYNSIGSAVNPSMQDSGRDAWGISLGITLPIRASSNRAAVREARFSLEAARQAQQQSINQSHTLINNLYFKIRTGERLVELYEKTLLPQARQTLQQGETWYNSGKSTMAELLETQSVWLNFELALARARADLAQNVARLEQAAGAPLLSGGGESK